MTTGCRTLRRLPLPAHLQIPWRARNIHARYFPAQIFLCFNTTVERHGALPVKIQITSFACLKILLQRKVFVRESPSSPGGRCAFYYKSGLLLRHLRAKLRDGNLHMRMLSTRLSKTVSANFPSHLVTDIFERGCSLRLEESRIQKTVKRLERKQKTLDGKFWMLSLFYPPWRGCEFIPVG